VLNEDRISNLAESLTLTTDNRQLSLARRLRKGLVVVLKHAQSMTSGGHIEEPLIFQRELQKKIARPNRKEQGEKKYHGRHGAHGPKGWDQEKSANAEADNQQEQTNRSSQEKLKSDIAKFVGQQDAQGFRGVDQITERTLWGNCDQIAAEHVGKGIKRTPESLERANLQANDMGHTYDKYRILSIGSFFRACTSLKRVEMTRMTESL
jgi:hypothetical protein